MSNLIGEKDKFAIEYDLTKSEPYIMGNMCVWVNNDYIGYFNEEIIISTAQYALNHLLQRLTQLENPLFNNQSQKEIYEILSSDEIDNGQYILTMGESFDDFIVYVIRKGNDMLFMWQLCDMPFYNYTNYDKNLKYKSISIDYFIKCIREFNRQLSIQERA